MKKPERTLGDKINRTFCIIVVVLGSIFIGRAAVKITLDQTLNNSFIECPETFKEYPETQDNFGETANGLGIDRKHVTTSIDSAYVDGFYDETLRNNGDVLSRNPTDDGAE